MATVIGTAPIILQGKSVKIASETTTGSGTSTYTTTTESDGVVLSLWVSSISGTLDVSVYTQMDDEKDLLIDTFTQVVAPTTRLITQKIVNITNQLKVVLTYSGAVTYEMQARGVSSTTISAEADNGTYQAIQAGENGGLKIDTPRTAFGAQLIAQTSPYINLSAHRGLPERFFETYTSGAGSSSGLLDNAPGLDFSVQTGTNVGGYGVLRSKKVLAYHPGIGTLARFTARFTTPVANSIQRAGLFNIGNELTFGYDGTQFGILRRSGGRPEIRKLTITVATGTSVNCTVTLNGSATVVPITSGTTAHNAAEIAAATYSGWTAYNVDNTVYFQASTVDAKSGAYTATPASGTFVGAFSQTRAGASVTDTWTYQSDWNQSTLSNQHDEFILDPTKGSVYQIQFQYLGYGAINFYIENPNTGKFTWVHTVRYANSATRPSMDLPDFKLGIIAASAGSTTNLRVSSGSLSGFHECGLMFPPKVHSTIRSVTGIGTTLTNVLAIKKTSISLNQLDISDILIDNLAVSVDGTKNAIVEVRLNPTFSAERTWEALDEDTSLVATSSGGTVTGGEVLYTAALPKVGNITVDTDKLGMYLSTDDVISIGVRAVSATTDAVASVVYGL
jgi:hypothetical protein